MAINTVYNLNFQPGVRNGELTANYSLNFTNFSTYDYWNRGSYNGSDTPARSLYLNNKQNNTLVSVNCDNGQYVREVPPYGEAMLPIDGRQTVSINATGGGCRVEFSNVPAGERIFQRTDSVSATVQFSGTLGTTQNDLLTVDRIGRLQTADAQPFASNNTTVDIQQGTAFPARPAPVNFTASSYSLMDSLGRVVCVDNATGAQLGIWIVNNAGVNISANHSVAGACVPQPINEGPLAYYSAWQNQNCGVVISKTTGAVSHTPTPPFATGYLCTFPKANGVNSSDLWILCNRTNFFELAGYDNNVLTSNVTSMITGANSYNAATDCMFGCAWGTGSNVLAVFWDNTGNLYMGVFNGLTGGSTLGSLIVAAGSNLQNKGRNWVDVAVTVNGYGFLPYRNTGTGSVHLAVVTPAGAISTVNTGFSGTMAFGAITSDNGYIVCAVNGLTLNAAKYDATGVLVTTASFTLAAGTWNGISPIPITEDENAFLLCYNTGGLLRAIVINANLVALVGIASPLASNLAIGANHWPCYVSQDDFAMVNPGASPPVVALNDLAKSVFGVDKGEGAVLVQGYSNINQVFSGSTTFNQNAATVVGNRGIVINNTVQLNGLT